MFLFIIFVNILKNVFYFYVYLIVDKKNKNYITYFCNYKNIHYVRIISSYFQERYPSNSFYSLHECQTNTIMLINDLYNIQLHKIYAVHDNNIRVKRLQYAFKTI